MSAAAKLSPKLQLDEFAIQQCENAVVTTFRTMFGIEPRLTQVQRGVDQRQTSANDILAIMNIVQEQTEGAIVLRCGFTTISPIVSTLFGDKNLKKDAADSIGELTNVIFGIMTDSFNKRGFNIQMSLPMVVVGESRTLTESKISERLRLNFETSTGPFFLEMLLLSDSLDGR